MIRCGIERGCNRKLINSKLVFSMFFSSIYLIFVSFEAIVGRRDIFLFPEHLSSPPVFSGVRVTRSLVLYVLFCSKRFLRFLENHSINIYISSVSVQSVNITCRSSPWKYGICYVDRCFSFCTFSFGHYVVCSSIYTDSDCPFGIFKLFFTWSESALKPWPV
jgi:hypothetical protein